MGLFSCSICDKSFDNFISYQKHMSLTHKIKSVDTYVKTYLNGIYPICECGCGKTPKFLGENKGFRRFLTGHNSSTPSNNFHKNPETKIKSSKTQSDNWKNGKYKGWWENNDDETKQKIEGIKEKLRNNKERGRKISKSLSGIKKSDEHKKKVSETQLKRYKKNPNLKKELSEKRLVWMKKNSKVKTSKLEISFSMILESLGLVKNVDFIPQYLISNINTFFDFYIPSKNILLEIDGDFYHCNPNTKFKEPKYDIQKKNLYNDKRKNTYCSNHNIKLLRFWEKDINEKPDWVLSEIKKHIL